MRSTIDSTARRTIQSSLKHLRHHTGSFDGSSMSEAPAATFRDSSDTGSPWDSLDRSSNNFTDSDIGNFPDGEPDDCLNSFLTRYQLTPIPVDESTHLVFPLRNSLGERIVFKRYNYTQNENNDSTIAKTHKNNNKTTAPTSKEVIERQFSSMILEWCLPTLLEHISIDNLLLVLGCAMTEMQVVFVSSDVQTLSCSVVAVIELLRPLKWPFPVIVTLPNR